MLTIAHAFKLWYLWNLWESPGSKKNLQGSWSGAANAEEESLRYWVGAAADLQAALCRSGPRGLNWLQIYCEESFYSDAVSKDKRRSCYEICCE